MGTFDIYHEWVHHLKVYVLNDYGGSFRINKVLWKKQSLAHFEYLKASYVVNLKKAIFTSRNNPILFYRINNPEPMEFSEVHGAGIKGSAKELQGVIKDKSTTDILNEGQDTKILLVVGVFVILIIVIAGVAMYMLNQQSKEIAKLALDLAKAYANSTRTGPVVIP